MRVSKRGAGRGLSLSPEKTKITHIDDGFEGSLRDRHEIFRNTILLTGLNIPSSATVPGGLHYTRTGSTQAVTVYGRVAGSQTTVPVGSYADTVAVTITVA